MIAVSLDLVTGRMLYTCCESDKRLLSARQLLDPQAFVDLRVERDLQHEGFIVAQLRMHWTYSNRDTSVVVDRALLGLVRVFGILFVLKQVILRA